MPRAHRDGRLSARGGAEKSQLALFTAFLPANGARPRQSHELHAVTRVGRYGRLCSECAPIGQPSTHNFGRLCPVQSHPRPVTVLKLAATRFLPSAFFPPAPLVSLPNASSRQSRRPGTPLHSADALPRCYAVPRYSRRGREGEQRSA